MTTGAAAIPRAVLDSNVIYSRVLHELMGRAALGGRLLDLIWSDELLDEAKRVLREHKGLDAEIAETWVGHLPAAFPSGRVDPALLPAGVVLSSLTKDPDDEFVCALALAGGAQLLFTFDRGYLRAPLARHGVAVVSPDTWLSAAAAEDPELFEQLLHEQAAVWGGGRPVSELIDAFERARVPVFAAQMRALLGR